MGMVAGMLIQNTLKYLLKFGDVSYYLGYNALNDFFPQMRMRPNPNCDDRFCLKRQEEYQSKLAESNLDNQQYQKKAETEEIVHEENEWNISVVDESTNDSVGIDPTEVSKGIRFAYDKPDAHIDSAVSEKDAFDDVPLDELMKQMKNL